MAASVLAIATLGFWAAEAHAQTYEDSYFKYEGTRTVEEGSSITITVTAKGSGGELIFGSLKILDWPSSRSSEVADAGVDFPHVREKLVVGPGESKKVTLPTTEDSKVEHDEHFQLRFRGELGDVRYTTILNATILNDDRATITVSDARAVEGDALEFKATLSTFLYPRSVTLTPKFTNVTASGSDYTASTGSITFRSYGAQTFRVNTTRDSVQEEDETFTVGFALPDSSPAWNYTGEGSAIAIVAGTGTIEDSTPTLTVGHSHASEGDSMTFTVKLDKALSGGLTVTPGFTDVTATEGTDYTANTAALTFAGTAGETQTFTIATTEDIYAEGDETFTVGLSVTGTQTTVRAADTATGTIRDDDGDLPAVTIADASAAEGDTLTFTVTLDKAVLDGLTVTPRFDGGSTPGYATEGTDFTENTAPLSFTGTAGEQRTFTVATIEDTDIEPDEIFHVKLVVSEAQVRVKEDSATGTILDDDTPKLTIGDASAVEGDSMTFTVTLDKALSGGLKVTPGFTDGTATKGTDYTANTVALTFAGTAGETKAFTVPTIEDSPSEADETFTVGLNVSGTSVTVTATDTATGTIVDDDDPPVTVADASAAEGDSMTFTVTLRGPVPGGLTVTPNFTDGTATEGTDYTENTAALSFTGTAGETRTFAVSTIDDADAEADETFTVGLSVSGTSVTVVATDTATGTIADDDRGPAVTIGSASATEGDSMTFTVTLDKAVSGGLKVTPDFTDGTATKGADYTQNTAALTFTGTAGETQTFTVSTTEDAGREADETFTVGLAVSGTSTTVTATDTATGTIVDDDWPALTIDDASSGEGGAVTFTVTLDGAVSGGLTVTPSYTDGSATKGIDYIENTAALTFVGTAGEEQSFTVTLPEDTEAEAQETFTVSLTVSGTTATVTATDTGTGTIIDNETSAVVPAVTIADASASEGDSITFTVTLSSKVSGGLTVTPSFTDRTAANGIDYTENTAALTFTGTGGETRTFTVATTEDTDDEPDETFTVGLAVSGTSDTVTATDTATGTIVDDDGSPTVTVADASADEGDSLTFTVTLDKAVSGGLKVTPSFTDGTATQGTDYTGNTATLTFTGTKGETRTFTVATTEDTVDEPDETFTVGLAVSGTSETVTATDTATGTIVDDDGSPTVTVADASADEGDSLTFTVTLDKAVSGDGFKVTPSFADVTATKGTDYTENTAALTFTGTKGETRTFTVATTEDTVDEPDETFTVGLAVSGTSQTVTATDTATGTIDDDDRSATVTIADAAAHEGDPLTFTVTLDKAVSGGLTVTPSFTDGTATKGTDYTENTAALAFTGTKGETRTFTVATTEDADDEPDETFTVGLTVSGTSASVTATDTATGTITNDDGSAAPAVTIADASADEGDSLTFTVTLDKAVSGGLTVTPSFTDGTATKGTDYTESTAGLAFTGTKGETRTFAVATTEDTVDEPDETFAVSLAVSETSETITATDAATGTIVDDDVAAVVTIGDASANEGDSLTFTVTLDKAVAGGFTVTPSFTDVTTTKGTDYTENTAALTFTGTKGETETFTVATAEDSEEEEHETFAISLTVSGTSTTVTATDTATGTIIDEDTPSLTITDASANEGDPLTFTLTLDKKVPGGFEVITGFLGATAKREEDFRVGTNVFKFKGEPGETEYLRLETVDDEEEETDETFSVLPYVVKVDRQVNTNSATGTILDDDDGDHDDDNNNNNGDDGDDDNDDDNDDGDNDDGDNDDGDGDGDDGDDDDGDDDGDGDDGDGDDGDGDDGDGDDGDGDGDDGDDDDDDTPARVMVADASAVEGDPLTFTVTLDRAVTGGLTVTPELANETATSGDDYRAVTPALRFAGMAGETRTFSVPTVEDAVEEDAETFLVSLNVSATRTTVTADTARGRIADDDLAPVVLRAEPARIPETAGPTAVLVTAALERGVPVTQATAVSVTVGAATDAAASGLDYTASPASFTVTIPAGAVQGSSTFMLDPENDTLMEPDEVLTVAGASTSRQVTGAAVTLEDDDTSAADLVVRLEPDSVSESAGPTQVTVVAEVVGATPTMPLPVAMRVGEHEDTARLNLDYEPVDAFTVTIPAGETQYRTTFVLTPIEDDLIEGNETLTVSGREARLGEASDEGMIRDEDLAEARSEGAGRTLFLLARAIGSESLAALEERFAGAGLGRRARLGAVPSSGPGALDGWGGRSPVTGTPGLPGGGSIGASGMLYGPAGPSAAFGHDALSMGLAMPAQERPFEQLAWLDGAGFATPLAGSGAETGTPGGAETGDPAGWVVWGRAGTTQTAVQATPGAQARGDLFTVHLGIDTRVGSRLLVGVAASHSRGKLGYTLGGQASDVPAAVDGDLTSAQPYVQWTPRPGLEVWGFGGAGRGTLQVVDTFGTVDTGLGMRMGAGGARQEVTPGSGLAVKADVFHVTVASDATLDLPVAQATATRARVLLEWESEWAPTPAARLRPRLEVGGRWDGGSDVDGFGSEVGAGLALAHTGLGLELSGSGRYLLAHQAVGFEEWGASLALRAGPGVTRRGAWVSVEPEWGAAASRMHAMWGQQPDPGLHPGAALRGTLGAEPARLRLAAGYALPEAGTDLRVEATRETYDPRSGPSVGVRFSSQVGW